MSYHSYHGGFHGGHGGFNHFSRPLNWNALGKFDSLTPQVQRHLQKVYATLSGGLLAATLGAYVDHKFHVAGMVSQLSFFAAVIGLTFIAGLVRWCAGARRRRAGTACFASVWWCTCTRGALTRAPPQTCTIGWPSSMRLASSWASTLGPSSHKLPSTVLISSSLPSPVLC